MHYPGFTDLSTSGISSDFAHTSLVDGSISVDMSQKP